MNQALGGEEQIRRRAEQKGDGFVEAKRTDQGREEELEPARSRLAHEGERQDLNALVLHGHDEALDV